MSIHNDLPTWDENSASQIGLAIPHRHDLEDQNQSTEATWPTSKAWLQVLVSHMLAINSFGYFFSFAVFQSFWQEELKQSQSNIAWTGSIQLFLIFFVGTLSGRLIDAGYFRSLILVGSSLQIIGTFATSLVQTYWQLMLFQGVIQGLGNGLLYTPIIVLITTCFERRQALAMSVTACGAPVGGIVFSIIAQQLAPRIGFRGAVRVMGALITFNVLVILILARLPRISRHKSPFLDLTAWREPAYTLFGIGIFFICLALYFAYFYTVTFGQDVIRLSGQDSHNLPIILNAVGIPGRILPALLADASLDAFMVLLPLVFCSGGLFFCWIAVHDVIGYYAFMVVFGVVLNAVQVLFPVALASLVTNKAQLGVRTGMVFTVLSFACLIGPPIAGTLIGHAGGTYFTAQLFGGATLLLGFIILSVARYLKK